MIDADRQQWLDRGVLVTDAGEWFRLFCNCGAHPHRGHDATPMYPEEIARLAERNVEVISREKSDGLREAHPAQLEWKAR